MRKSGRRESDGEMLEKRERGRKREERKRGKREKRTGAQSQKKF